MTLRDRFDRTVCSCSSCRADCVAMPGSLAPGDAERIADYLKVQPHDRERWELDHLQSSEGAAVLTVGGRAMRIPTVVPRLLRGRGCVFLDEQGRCRVHPVAPFACSHFDHHMSNEQSGPRAKALLVACHEDHAYNALRRRLLLAGRIAPKLSTRRNHREHLLCRP